ncbi:MAG: TRAP transporter small permease [Alphaproteobacteria bacterium]
MQPRTLIDRIFWHAGALMMLAMTGIMVYVVTARYFFDRPPLWSEDVPRTIFIWMVFLTLGLAIKLGLNIRVTTLTDAMPLRWRYATETCMHACVLAMLGVLLWFTVPLLRLKYSATMLSTGWSEIVLVLPMFLGFVLAAIYQARKLARVVMAWRAGIALSDDQHAGAGLG